MLIRCSVKLPIAFTKLEASAVENWASATHSSVLLVTSSSPKLMKFLVEIGDVPEIMNGIHG
jgi:hypothetical protein